MPFEKFVGLKACNEFFSEGHLQKGKFALPTAKIDGISLCYDVMAKIYFVRTVTVTTPWQMKRVQYSEFTIFLS